MKAISLGKIKWFTMNIEANGFDALWTERPWLECIHWKKNPNVRPDKISLFWKRQTWEVKQFTVYHTISLKFPEIHQEFTTVHPGRGEEFLPHHRHSVPWPQKLDSKKGDGWCSQNSEDQNSVGTTNKILKTYHMTAHSRFCVIVFLLNSFWWFVG